MQHYNQKVIFWHTVKPNQQNHFRTFLYEKCNLR